MGGGGGNSIDRCISMSLLGVHVKPFKALLGQHGTTAFFHFLEQLKSSVLDNTGTPCLEHVRKQQILPRVMWSVYYCCTRMVVGFAVSFKCSKKELYIGKWVLTSSKRHIPHETPPLGLLYYSPLKNHARGPLLLPW